MSYHKKQLKLLSKNKFVHVCKKSNYSIIEDSISYGESIFIKSFCRNKNNYPELYWCREMLIFKVRKQVKIFSTHVHGNRWEYNIEQWHQNDIFICKKRRNWHNCLHLRKCTSYNKEPGAGETPGPASILRGTHAHPPSESATLPGCPSACSGDGSTSGPASSRGWSEHPSL